MTNAEYKQFLIEGILEYQTRDQFTRESLQKKTIAVLEKIYDNVD